MRISDWSSDVCSSDLRSRLDLATKFGATATFSASPEALTEALLQACPAGFDYVLDTTGIPSILRAGFNALNYWGTLGICGVGAGEVSFDMAALQSGRVIRTVFLGDRKSTRLNSSH